MSNESENKPARRAEDKRADGAVDWTDAPRFTALGIAETWAVTVEAEGQRVLCISEQHVAGLDDARLEPFVPTIRSCAQHLLGFIGATPRSTTAGSAQGGITSLERLTRYGWTEAYIGDTSELVEQADGTYVKFADVERLLATQAQAAAPATELSAERIEAIWSGIDGKAVIEGENQMNWNSALRRAFAKRIEREVIANADLAHPAAAVEPAVEQAEPLTNEAIDRLFSEMPGGVDGWLKQFGYRQFARAVARHVLVRVAASMAGTMRPTDDELWEQTIGERDCYHEWADKLADAIAKRFGAAIGEHSNMNCPWAEALDVIQAAPASLEQAKSEHTQFETWATKAMYVLDWNDEGHYESGDTESAWDGWKSRASLAAPIAAAPAAPEHDEVRNQYHVIDDSDEDDCIVCSHSNVVDAEADRMECAKENPEMQFAITKAGGGIVRPFANFAELERQSRIAGTVAFSCKHRAQFPSCDGEQCDKWCGNGEICPAATGAMKTATNEGDEKGGAA